MSDRHSEHQDVVIIGAGLAGLACARRLHERGVIPMVLESSDRVGGRVITDNVDGFRLDHGFQVLLTSYPAARGMLNFDALNLGRLYPGSEVWMDGSFARVADPWKQPLGAMKSIRRPAVAISDVWRLARLRRAALNGQLARQITNPAQSTMSLLKQWGFKPRTIDAFFRPFFGGVFLDRDLETSARMFEFVFRMFTRGYAAVPNHGMQAIPEQIAASLPPDTVRLNTPVVRLGDHELKTADGATIRFDQAVIATDPATAARLRGESVNVPWRGCRTLYFAAGDVPSREPILYLDASSAAPTGPLDHCCVISNAAAGYAPDGQSLVSATIIDHADNSEHDESALVTAAQTQLETWFGSIANRWSFIRSYHVPQALPVNTSRTTSDQIERVSMVSDTVVCCGDYLADASINGAIESGVAAARMLVERLRPETEAA